MMIRSAFLVTVVMILACKDIKPPTLKNVESHTSEEGMVYIPAGVLSMGGDNAQAEANEFPKHKINLKAFLMDETEVTNRAFQKFVNATQYVTIAERPIDWEVLKKELPPNAEKPADSILVPGALIFNPTAIAVPLDNPVHWWKWQIGANWKHPYGPESSIDEIMDHPVVHIAYEDALAYCNWAKKRLPTEAEWEWAARGGKENMIYPWGNEPVNEGQPKANFYQGLFPVKNLQIDGFEYSAPVKSFPANDYGLYDMAGNVWEWCHDWFDVSYYQQLASISDQTKGPDTANNPVMPFQKERVIRGGSFLCNDQYCSGYRNARRMGSSPDTGLCHTGFRCVKDL
ncbi:MAG TPA: formylglycine-generating enzyme family protein [Saprospiraceae bacterium]|nr:formylglycine-generating enzyme family protein [Saprospiraceae bacterium]